MATSSQLGAVRTAFKAALLERPALSTVAISKFTPAADDVVATEQIWFQSQVTGSQEPASPTKRHDDLPIVLVVQVRLSGGGETVAAAAEDRALALFAECEAVIASDTTLGGVILGITPPSEYSVDHDTESGNRLCIIEARVLFMTEIDNA